MTPIVNKPSLQRAKCTKLFGVYVCVYNFYLFCYFDVV